MPVKVRSPGGSSRRSSGLARLRSLDTLVLLSCAAAVILLLPLRGLSGAFPPLAFGAVLALFTAPGFLLSHWLLRYDMSGMALVPVGFAISTGIFGLIGVPALILHLSTEEHLRRSLLTPLTVLRRAGCGRLSRCSAGFWRSWGSGGCLAATTTFGSICRG